MFAHNTEDVIESDEYGEAVFDAEVIYPEKYTLVQEALSLHNTSVQSF